MESINCVSSPMVLYEDEVPNGFWDQKPRDRKQKEISESPPLFLIGSIETVNQKIAGLNAHLNVETKKCNSEDLLISGAFKESTHDTTQTTLKDERTQQMQSFMETKQNELQICTYRYQHSLASKPFDLHSQMQVANKNQKSKPRLVELYQFPGLSNVGPTKLPYGISLDFIIGMVVSAHENTGGKICSSKDVYRILNSPGAKKIILGSFWWIFLQSYKPDTDCQKQLFDCVAENYIKLLDFCWKMHSGEAFLKIFPTVLSQTIYSSFCYSFPQSLHRFQSDDFKTQLCNLFWQWIGGVCPSPGSYKTWNFNFLEPKDDIVLGTEIQNRGSGSKFGEVKGERRTLKPFLSNQLKPAKESHPVCSGPDFSHKLFNIKGHSPLVQYYLQKGNYLKTGLNILVRHTEIKKQIPVSSMTYAEVIKQGFHHLHKQKNELNDNYRRRCKETLQFDRSLRSTKKEFLNEEKQILSQKNEVKRISQQIFSDFKKSKDAGTSVHFG